MACPSVEAIGDGEIEAVVKPSAFDEDGANLALVRLRVGLWYFKLQARLPDCIHGASLTSRTANGGRLLMEQKCRI